MDTGQIDKLKAWPRIQVALEDPRWDFRTVEGISRETGLHAACIVELLEEHQPEVPQGGCAGPQGTCVVHDQAVAAGSTRGYFRPSGICQ